MKGLLLLIKVIFNSFLPTENRYLYYGNIPIYSHQVTVLDIQRRVNTYHPIQPNIVIYRPMYRYFCPNLTPLSLPNPSQYLYPNTTFNPPLQAVKTDTKTEQYRLLTLNNTPNESNTPSQGFPNVSSSDAIIYSFINADYQNVEKKYPLKNQNEFVIGDNLGSLIYCLKPLLKELGFNNTNLTILTNKLIEIFKIFQNVKFKSPRQFILFFSQLTYYTDNLKYLMLNIDESDNPVYLIGNNENKSACKYYTLSSVEKTFEDWMNSCGKFFKEFTLGELLQIIKEKPNIYNVLDEHYKFKQDFLLHYGAFYFAFYDFFDL
ncbi:hypothetical protein TUBRATIS_14860 [Tubulinosema ratisbonensis]|uniref:Uncharacterized protein n=1 Tax=Tubulinosema ratisbonensis TaxID=291195 RepID=A0A437ALR3_9MICR|nr:hypothetical protein TUBRATIS_14860 [Tubulinosema ratisbonensis]